MKQLFIFTTLVFFFAAPLNALPCETCKVKKKDHLFLTKKDLKWMDAPAALPPGAKVAVLYGNPGAAGPFAMRIEAPDGYRVGPHSHPADEHVTVLSGTFNIGLGESFDKSKSRAFKEGAFMMMKKGTRHFAWAKGRTVVQLHGIGPWGISYVNPVDDPRNR